MGSRKLTESPTVRRARNRGFEPVRYRSEHEVLNGWIEKRGRKWLHCFFPGAGRKKLRKDEERYMTPL